MTGIKQASPQPLSSREGLILTFKKVSPSGGDLEGAVYA